MLYERKNQCQEASAGRDANRFSPLHEIGAGGIMSGGPSPEAHAPAATPHDTSSSEALAASENGSTEQ